MISKVAGRIFHYSYPETGKLNRLPGSVARFTGMHRFCNIFPVNALEGNITHTISKLIIQ
jgi:hypothetical protein